jgi:hypothetical protein
LSGLSNYSPLSPYTDLALQQKLPSAFTVVILALKSAGKTSSSVDFLVKAITEKTLSLIW